MNAFCALNIDVMKTKFGQKLQHSLLHQLIFTYIWYNYYLSCHVMMNHQKLPLPPKKRNSGSGDNFFDTLKNKQQFSFLQWNLLLAQSLYILKVIFSMIYLSIILIYPYAVHSPVPHSLIQSRYWWAYTDVSHDDKPFFNHLAQCLSLFKTFTTMHIQCLPLPPCLLFKSYAF